MDLTSQKYILPAMAVLIIIISLSLIIVVAINFESEWNQDILNKYTTNNVLTEDEAKLLVESYVRQNMYDASNAKIILVTDATPMLYSLTFDLDSDGENIVEGFVTKDGLYFIPAAYKIDKDYLEIRRG